MPAGMNGLLLGERFVLEREIGSGGMARVFLGKDTVLDRPVAVKVLNPGHDETDIGARFRREGRTAARLSHPNIVQVYDAGEGELDGKVVSYIVMEYVPGGDLKGMIDGRGTLPEEDLARLGAGAAAGLAHAHERGVIHRDVKPHNVLIDAYGEPKLTDFGIARALDATTSNATRTGAYLGTALYSAPEQLRGEKVTPKSDVYSLGVTLYQAAVGEAPFVGTPIEVAGQHVHQTPSFPEADGVAVGEVIKGLILDCLAKDPEGRPTAQKVHERLRAEENRLREQAEPPPVPPLPEPGPARPAQTASPALQRSRRRRRLPLLLAAAALLVTLLGLAAFAASRGGNDPGTASNGQQGGQQAQAPANDGGNDAGRGSRPAGDTSQNRSGQASDKPAQTPSGSQGSQQQGQTQQAPPPENRPQNISDSGAAGGLTAQAAVQTVVNHYDTAASPNYADAWNFLSPRYQAQIGSPQQWTDQFSTLKSVEFTQGPTAQVDGDTATVSFSDTAYHSYGAETRSGTATLVAENGVWKIDSINVQ